MGFAIIEGGPTAPRLIESGVLTAPASEPPAVRLGRLFCALAKVVDRTAPECVAVESSFFGKNALSMLRLGEARGCALALAGSRGLPAFDYAPARVKKSVTGNGNASKEQVARALQALLPGMTSLAELDWLDQSDAVAVAWCHLAGQELIRRNERVAAAMAPTVERKRPARGAPRAASSNVDAAAAVARWRARRRR